MCVYGKMQIYMSSRVHRVIGMKDLSRSWLCSEQFPHDHYSVLRSLQRGMCICLDF